MDKQLWAATAVIVMSLIVSLISAMVYQTHHFEKHIDALRSEMNHRFDDFRMWIQSEFGRVNDRLERVEKRLDGVEKRLDALEAATRVVRP